MKNKILVAGLLSFLMACNSSETVNSSATATKGNNEFKARMAQGIGTFRPDAVRTEEKLSLNGFQVAATKIDEHSGSWTWAGFDTASGEVIPAGSDLKIIARSLVSQHQVELGFAPEEILEVDYAVQEPYEGMKLVTMRRQYNSTEIKGAFVNIFFAVKEDGSLRLREIVNNSFGPVRISGSPLVLDDSESIEATGVSTFKVEEKKGIIAPSLVDGRYEFSYATEFLLKDSENGEIVSLTVDNGNKSIHEAFSHRIYESTVIEAESYKTSYVLKDLIMRPLEFLTIIDSGKTTSTDELGKVDVSSNKVQAVLRNTKNTSAIFDARDKSKPIAFDIDIGKDGKTSLKFGQGNNVALNVYASITETLDFAEQHLTSDELKLIKKSFGAIIDIDKTCNAFYDGNFLNFFKEGGGCANTGLISDVVKHEWGHGLDDFLGIKSRHTRDTPMYGITDGAYSEGISDTVASYVSRSSNMGQGFRLGSKAPLRQLLHDKTYPPKNSSESESHRLGELTGGAFWRMHVNLTALYGADIGNAVAAKLFFKHLKSSDRYLDAYPAVVRVDDDDNNALTRSPHYCAITKAFAHHNIAGGEKVPANCLDTDTTVRVKIEADQGDGKLSLVLSAGGAAKIIACADKVTSCKAGDKGYLEFPSADGDDIETIKGSRKFYSTAGVIDAKANGTYSFFSLDSKGTLLAKRTMEFKSASLETSAPIK